jgi:hypothetical protein
MPLPVPNLDDRTFADLVAEGRSMIPRYAPEWTNYNPSDPGITLLELFAWLTEMILYRLNQVPEEHYRVFLELIGVSMRAGEPTQAAIRRALQSLGARSRAVTLEDFEVLARHATSSDVETLATKIRLHVEELRLEDFGVLAREPGTEIVRAKALADRNLEERTPATEGHVSVIILPSAEALGLGSAVADRTCGAFSNAVNGEAMQRLTETVKRNLDPFRLLTTIVHVVAPEFVEVRLHIELAPRADALPDEVHDRVTMQVRTFLDPYVGGEAVGGEAGTGWPFGRSVYRSELYQLVEDVRGVDHVVELRLNGNATAGAIPVGDHQLVCLAALTVIP